MQSVKSIAIYVCGFAMVIVGAVAAAVGGVLPPGVESALVASGTVLTAVERYLQTSGVAAK